MQRIQMPGYGLLITITLGQSIESEGEYEAKIMFDSTLPIYGFDWN